MLMTMHILKFLQYIIVSITCVIVAITCFIVSITCFIVAIPCVIVAILCFIVSITCFIVSITCFIVAIPCVIVAITCSAIFDKTQYHATIQSESHSYKLQCKLSRIHVEYNVKYLKNIFWYTIYIKPIFKNMEITQ